MTAAVIGSPNRRGVTWLHNLCVQTVHTTPPQQASKQPCHNPFAHKLFHGINAIEFTFHPRISVPPKKPPSSWKRPNTRSQVVAEEEKSALRVHCVHGIPSEVGKE